MRQRRRRQTRNLRSTPPSASSTPLRRAWSAHARNRVRQPHLGRAPHRIWNGVISKKSIEAGQVVQPGQPLMAVTSLDDVWVTANFKETQLRDMKPGQRADVSVDAYGRTFHGHVDSISAATGATFSLLPPDN